MENIYSNTSTSEKVKANTVMSLILLTTRMVHPDTQLKYYVSYNKTADIQKVTDRYFAVHGTFHGEDISSDFLTFHHREKYSAGNCVIDILSYFMTIVLKKWKIEIRKTSCVMYIPSGKYIKPIYFRSGFLLSHLWNLKMGFFERR